MDPLRHSPKSASTHNLTPGRKGAKKDAAFTKVSDSYSPGAAVKKEVTLGDIAGAVLSGSGNVKNASVWESSMGDFSSHSPAQGPGKTILVSDSCKYPNTLYAFDRDSGELLWKGTLSGHLDAAPYVAKDGTIIAGTRGETVAAFDAAGDFKWKIPVDGQINRAPVEGKNGTLFYSTLEDQVLSVNPKTGKHKTLYKKSLPDKYPGSVSPPLSVGADGTLYIGGADHILYALNPTTGKEKWTLPTTTAILGPPITGIDGTVYAAEKDWCLYAVDPKTGKKKWEAHTQGGYSIDSPMVLTPGGSLFASNSFNIYCFDAATGAKAWETNETGIIASGAPMVPHDGALLASGFEGICSFDEKTGKLNWKLETKGTTHIASRVTQDGTLFATGEKGTVYAVDVKTGETKWTFKAQGDIYTPPTITDDGFVYFSATDGNVYCIRADRKPGLVIESTSTEGGMEITKGEGFVIVGGVKLPVKKDQG